MKRPGKNEYAPFHATYIKALPARGTARSLLKSTWKDTVHLLQNISEEKSNYAYEKGKWTIKQVLIHLIDAERVFCFRLLWFLRGDRASLPGFNQEFWMEFADVSDRTVRDLLKEYKLVRDHTLFLLNTCSDSDSRRTGTASNFTFSVRAMFYIIAGHHLHHLKVLKERYLPESTGDAETS